MTALHIVTRVSGDDAQWIRQTLQGNTAAFGNIVRKYQNRLFRSVAVLTGDRDEALDVVQETFVQAMLKLGLFEQRSQFFTWLYRIAYNLAAKARRQRRRRLRLTAAIRWMAGVEQPFGSGDRQEHDRPDKRLEHNERCIQVQRALAQLRQPHLSVVILREIDGLAYEEIGRVLSLRPGTVRSRLHRARLQLLRKLRGMETGFGR